MNPIVILILWLLGSLFIFLLMFFLETFNPVGVFGGIFLAGIGIFSYIQQIKANKKEKDIINGNYFSTPEWKEAYLQYKDMHPFEHPQERTLKDDLFRRYRSRETFLYILMYLLLLVGAIVGMVHDFDIRYPFSPYILGVPVFVFLLVDSLNTFTGRPVRKWLKLDIDYPALETSYQHGSMLIYKGNGINLGTTHIHAYTPQTVYAIDYELVKSITRKFVRSRERYQPMNTSQEYRHFVVIHVRLPESGNMTQIEIELNEFQVEMILDEFARIKGSTATQNEFTVKYDS